MNAMYLNSTTVPCTVSPRSLPVGQEQAPPGIGEEVLVAPRAPAALADQQLVHLGGVAGPHDVGGLARVQPILQEMLGFVPPEPAATVLDMVDAWTDRHPG